MPSAALLLPRSYHGHFEFWISLSRMKITRRRFVYLSCGSWGWRMLGQSGVASRGLKQQPRPAPSGRPFDAHFVDVAESAGLTLPTIYGGVDRKEYILEADGCGCAFIDYDNDGWMDIFLLTGMRLDGRRSERRTVSTKIIVMEPLPTSPRKPACTTLDGQTPSA